MELAAREYILKKRRDERMKRILMIIGLVIATAFALSLTCLGR